MSSKTEVNIVPLPTPTKKRKLRRLFILAGLALALLLVGLLFYLNSGSFRETVRQRVIAELRQMTGGKVEVESFTWNLSRLHFEARNVTIHGREAAREVPYAHADRIGVDVKIVSFFTRKISLESAAIDHFVLHLMVYPDGTTNQPPPEPSVPSNEAPTQNLFDLAVKQIAVRQGTLMLNHKRIPFDLDGKDISAGMNYVPSQKAYDGHLDLTPLRIRYRNAPPMQAEMHAGFLLRSGETEIKSLRLSTENSKVEASGTIRNYINPELTLQYQALLDLAQVGKTAKWKQLRSGRAELKGAGSYQNKRYSSQGTLSVGNLEWHDATARISAVDFFSPYSVTQDKIVLSRLIAHVFGGTVQGDAQVANWNSSPPSGKKVLPPQGATRLHLAGIQISKVAAAVSSARMPLDRIELTGNISGDINSSWTGSLERAISSLKLEVSPPVTPSPKEVPVTAQLQATYHGDVRTLDVAGLSLATRSIRVNATGALGSEKAQAHISVNATDLRELQPALDALDPGTRIPITLEGRSSFNGVVFGKLDALSARGRLELEKFDTEFHLARQPKDQQNKPPRIHWDALSADVTYSPSLLSLQRGTLRRGAAQLGFSASTTLRHGDFDENTSQLNVTLHVQNENVADMQALAGTSYQLTGVANVEMQATGTLRNLQGRGKLQIANLTVFGEPFKTFSSDLRLNGMEARLENIQLAHNGARFTGSVAYDLDNRNYHFDLTGANIDLANFRRFDLPRLSVQGQAGFHLTGSGSGDAPAINGEIDLRNIVLNRETVGNLTILAETHGEDVQLRGRSNFENAELNVDGAVHLRGEWPGQVTMKFSHLDFDPLIRAYFQGQITGHSSIAGSIDIRGPMKRPRSLVVTGNVTQLSAEVENVKLQNDGPIHFGLENEFLKIDEFRLTGTETDLSAKGTVQLTGEHMLDLRSRGRFNMKLLQVFNPNLVAYGPATFTVNVAGNSARPQLSGRLELKDASVSLLDLPNGLSHISGSLIFAQDRMQIEKLTAHTGGGELNVGGFLAYRNGLYFDLTANGTDIRLRYPPGVSSSADATLRYTGSAKSSLLSGDVLVTRFGMNPHFDFANYLAQSKKAPMISTLNPFLDNMRLDMHITSTPELQVETSLAKLSGDLDLHVRGTAARPAIVGRVNIAEGDVFFNGTKYRLERGDITFSNPLTIEPVINLDMSARVQGYDVTIGLHGQAIGGKGLSMTYRSDPPLANSDIIALLAFGRTRGQGVYNASQPGVSTNDTASASNAILGEALNATFSDRVQRLFGASRVKIDPQFIGSENNPSARVTIEQQISNDITFTYVTSLTQSAETVIQVEYNIDKNVSIVAVRDQNGVLGFDIHIRKRKK
ncbi:MAG TPA: translocation/assembly module TamB domain-containing protein [Candidatus Dormibacteraeota bacterium]|nr:translocation/assembly module TamB domain-containing protein [Candidatus Dormibacteraeota bacterium]